MSRLKKVALVNDFDLVLRGLAGMLDPFRDRDPGLCFAIPPNMHEQPRGGGV